MKAFFNIFAQQIASAVVDYPFSGLIVNQSIESEYSVLEYECERFSKAGTYTLSLPIGLLASNKASVIVIAADGNATATITQRNYADSADTSFVVQIAQNEPFFACLHNVKSISVTINTDTVLQSFFGKISLTSATSSSNPNQGIDAGSLPVGGIIAVSGVFSAPNSGYSETGILPFPSYLQQCDGSLVTDSESIFYGKFLPNLTGSKTLFGSTTAGGEASTSTNATLLQGMSPDWALYTEVTIGAGYTVRYFMRIK